MYPIYEATINLEDEISGVDFVALVDIPATLEKWQAFKQDDVKQLFKVDNEEKRIVSGVLMSCDTLIERKDADVTYYVTFSKNTIETIVRKFFKNGFTKNVNINHEANLIPDGCYLLESFIIDREKGINPPKGMEHVTNGSWFGSYAIDNDEVWQKVKDGTFNGFSVEGYFGHKLIKQENSQILDNMKNQKISKWFEQFKSLFENLPMDTTDTNNVELMDVTLEDGTPVKIDKLENGGKVMLITETGEVELASGTYKLASGETIEVSEGGVILSVAMPEVVEQVMETEMTKEIVEGIVEEKIDTLVSELVEEKMKAINAKFAAQEKTINDLKKANLELVNVLDALVEEPTANQFQVADVTISTKQNLRQSVNKLINSYK
jgi:hypothetical protein